jgi:putative transcriptional regulator
MSKDFIKNNVKKLRFDNGQMTQEALAKEVGVTRQTIIAIENGNYSPSLELAFRIALIFESNIDEVFSYSPNDNSK